MGPYTAEDLDRLPNLPPHTELIDGWLVPRGPQTKFRSVVVDLLAAALREAAPPELRVRRGMTVTLGPRQRPEPDLIVVRATADQGMNQTTYRPEDIVLVVEVDSTVRKRDLYEEAGIRDVWQIENDHGQAVAYTPTGIQFGRLRISAPFDIDVRLDDYQQM